MADFNKAIPIILKHEGGYVNHPNDPGGATNRGIIFRLFQKYASQLNLPPTLDALKNLSENNAKIIYQWEFWNKMQGDLFNDQQVANIVFDGFVNMGPRALRMLQDVLNVKPDGVIGPQTIRAVNAGNPGVIFEAYKNLRGKFYRDLAERKPPMQVFLKGWLNRINSFQYA